MDIVTVTEKNAQAKALFEEAKVLISNPKATAEERQKADKIIEEAKSLREEAAKLAEIEAKVVEIANQTETENKVKEPVRRSTTKFASWEEYLVAVFRANHKNAAFRKEDPRLQYFEDEKDGGHETKQMAENVGASGGFLVPTEFRADLQGALAEGALVRGRATIIRMARRQVDIPVLSQTGTTAGVPHWFGGMSFYWGEEGAEKTDTEPSFRKVTLTAYKLYGYTYASDELVQDSAISLGDFLSGPLGLAGGLQWMEDYAFINGTGVGQPLGVINAGATITVNRQAVGNPIQYTDLVNMLESFLPSGRGVWFVSQSAISNLLLMQDAAGGAAGLGTYIWGSTEKGVPNTLLGYPVIFTEKVPRVGTAGDVILADWRYYLLGDRQATTVETTQYDRWRYDQTSWRATHRIDGQPWLSAPLTYQDGTTQVSPFVILGAKST